MTETTNRAELNSQSRAAARWSWKDEPELMARLVSAQNAPSNCNQDIMTIVGFMSSRAELEKHLAYYEGRAAKRTN